MLLFYIYTWRLRPATSSNRILSQGRLTSRPNRVTSCRTIPEDNQTLFLDGFIVFGCRRTSASQRGWFIDPRGSGEKRKGTWQSATAGLCSIFSIQLPQPSALTNGDFRRQYPRIIRLSPVPLDPLPLDFEYFALGVLNIVKTSRNPLRDEAQQDRHASLPPRRMTRGRPEGRPSSRRRSHERCRLTCANDDETPGRSGPGDILRRTDSGGNLSTTSWRDRRITC